jgi:bacteriocin-like protein
MSDEFKEIEESELDKISGGMSTHPMPRDPIRPGKPPTHPAPGQNPIGGKRTNPVGG